MDYAQIDASVMITFLLFSFSLFCNFQEKFEENSGKKKVTVWWLLLDK